MNARGGSLAKAAGILPALALAAGCASAPAKPQTMRDTAADFASYRSFGLASAPVFPSLIATTPARLGPAHTSNGVGFQIAAAVLGQSLLPAFAGVLAGRLGLEVIGPFLFVAAVILSAIVQSLTSARRALNRQPVSIGPTI